MCWKTFSITTKTSFSFGGLNKNSPPSVLLSWHTKTCVRKMLDGRYWREMSCPYMAKEPSPISDSLETRDPGRFFWNFPESSEYLGITLPKTIMQVTKNAGLEDDSKLSKVGIFYDFPCFFLFFCSGVIRINGWNISPGGATVKHLKIFRLIYNSALETTALPPMRKPEMEGWRDHHHGLFTFCVKHTKWFLKHQGKCLCANICGNNQMHS